MFWFLRGGRWKLSLCALYCTYDHVKSSYVCLMNVAIDAFPITSPFDATIYIKYTFR